jgi:hypothetical protein
VRKRRIPKASKSEDEGSVDKGSLKEEASVILRRNTRRIHNWFRKTIKKVGI